FAACSDDNGDPAEDTADTAETTDTADTDTSDTSDTSDVTDTPDTSDTTDASDTMDVPEDMGMSLCTPPSDGVDATATYDAFTILGFVGQATVVKTGLNVVVTVEDEMFVGEFDPGTNCLPQQAGLLFPLCFLTPDGFPAEPETLGAMLVTGADDTIGIVAAHRQGVDRSCALSGNYALTASDTAVTPMDTDTMLVDAFVAEYAQYIMLFELPEQTVAVMGQS